MRTPTEYELNQLMHLYDPVKAHEYYLKNRELTGRKKAKPKMHTYEDGSSVTVAENRRRSITAKTGIDPRTGKTREQIAKEARAKLRKALSEQIDRLDERLKKLEAKIREMEQKDASENRKGKAKKERAAKEKDKPKSAAEKAKDARENEKYRDKHKQELKSKAKKASNKSGGGKKDSSKKKATVGDYKALATKVKGQIAVAKQKLAAL
jgi:chromosome segregation ATPase